MIRIKWRNPSTDAREATTFQDNYGTRARIEYKDGVAVITDANGGKHTFPLDTIESVYEDAPPRGF